MKLLSIDWNGQRACRTAAGATEVLRSWLSAEAERVLELTSRNGLEAFARGLIAKEDKRENESISHDLSPSVEPLEPREPNESKSGCVSCERPAQRAPAPKRRNAALKRQLALPRVDATAGSSAALGSDQIGWDLHKLATHTHHNMLRQCARTHLALSCSDTIRHISHFTKQEEQKRKMWKRPAPARLQASPATGSSRYGLKTVHPPPSQQINIYLEAERRRWGGVLGARKLENSGDTLAVRPERALGAGGAVCHCVGRPPSCVGGRTGDWIAALLFTDTKASVSAHARLRVTSALESPPPLPSPPINTLQNPESLAIISESHARLSVHSSDTHASVLIAAVPQPSSRRLFDPRRSAERGTGGSSLGIKARGPFFPNGHKSARRMASDTAAPPSHGSASSCFPRPPPPNSVGARLQIRGRLAGPKRLLISHFS
ncbi:hypothetical protein AAFF_G00048920 [Aldrovandia affinis]|uniref:Uncharacterized protein n=1 Tax=Aldrovandia affinis TaxID=143900 RepID=A0AAD7S1K7_9TELE|nr:hypothetical protein AAFF_G00048920 [Aldrovandia affinis]